MRVFLEKPNLGQYQWESHSVHLTILCCAFQQIFRTLPPPLSHRAISPVFPQVIPPIQNSALKSVQEPHYKRKGDHYQDNESTAQKPNHSHNVSKNHVFFHLCLTFWRYGSISYGADRRSADRPQVPHARSGGIMQMHQLGLCAYKTRESR